MNSVRLVPATPEILYKFYGKQPDRTVRAIAGVEGEEVLGIGGYYLTKESAVVFSEIRPEGMKKKLSIVKATKKVLEMAKKTGLPIYAVPDENIGTACNFLKRLGFVEGYKGVWRWLS